MKGENAGDLERLRLLHDQLPVVIWSVGTDLRFQSSQGGGLARLGLAPGEVVGRSLWEYFGTRDSEFPAIAAHRRALAGEPAHYRLEWAGRIYDAHVEPIRDPSGKVVAGAAGIALDVTERVLAEMELEASKRVYESLVETLDGIVWECDPDTQRFRFVSGQAQRILGYPARTWIDDPDFWLEHLHPEDRAWVPGFCLQETKAGRNHQFTYRMLASDGRTIWFRENCTVVVDKGRPVSLRGVMVDISPLKDAEAKRLDAEARLLQAQKLESLGVLAGGIAHDFNNLLVGILGNAALAGRKIPASSPAAENIDQIEKVARRAADLTNQLLAYSGKGRFQVRPVDLADVVRDMTGLLQTVISKKASLRILAEASPPQVLADVNQIRQVVMNLITNASDALENRPGDVTVTVGGIRADRSYLSRFDLGREIPEGEYVFLEVSDTGAGMTRETLERVFEPFFSTKGPGRGLGLAAVQGIVRSHSGGIKIESEPGRGTTFNVLFPATAFAGAEPSLEKELPAQDVEGWRPTGIVLVVDDEVIVRTVAQECLAAYGFTVLTAKDGREGLEIFRSRADEIRVVLLDLTMPDLDGEEVFRAMRLVRPEVRVVLTSGYDAQDATSRFAGRGLDAFVQKPFRPHELVEAIREALGE